MADEYSVDHESTCEHFLRVLSLGRGVDLTTFDNVSAKPKEKLFEEIRTRDATLHFNRHTGRVERHARSARNSIHELQRNQQWIEVMRSYPSGKTVTKKKDYTTSETLKPWEAPVEGALRGYIEEMEPVWNRLGYTPKAFHLTPIAGIGGGLQMRPDIHESSVYEGVLSVVEAFYFDLYLDFHNPGISLGENIIIVKDSNGAKPANDNWVKIYLRRENYEQAA